MVFRPAEISFEEVLRLFWEGHDPTQGMRQGNDVGTQYRSGIYVTSRRPARGRARRRASATPSGSSAAGYGEITTEIVDARGALLRRGLPPAVPGEEPERLLRPGRHGRVLPGRRGRRLARRRSAQPGQARRSRHASSRPMRRSSSASAGQRVRRRRATRPTRRARASGTGSAASRHGGQPHHHRHAVRQAHERLDAEALAARAATPRAARARACRAGLSPRSTAPPAPSAQRLAQVDTQAARRPASQRPSALRTTQSAVRLSQASPSTAAAPSATAAARAAAGRPPRASRRAAWPARRGGRAALAQGVDRGVREPVDLGRRLEGLLAASAPRSDRTAQGPRARMPRARRRAHRLTSQTALAQQHARAERARPRRGRELRRGAPAPLHVLRAGAGLWHGGLAGDDLAPPSRASPGGSRPARPPPRRADAAARPRRRACRARRGSTRRRARLAARAATPPAVPTRRAGSRRRRAGARAARPAGPSITSETERLSGVRHRSMHARAELLGARARRSIGRARP